MKRRELGEMFYAIKRFVLGLNLGDRGKKILRVGTDCGGWRDESFGREKANEGRTPCSRNENLSAMGVVTGEDRIRY